MKKEYKAPKIEAKEVKPASKGVCGLNTSCGDLVKSRR